MHYYRPLVNLYPESGIICGFCTVSTRTVNNILYGKEKPVSIPRM